MPETLTANVSLTFYVIWGGILLIELLALAMCIDSIRPARRSIKEQHGVPVGSLLTYTMFGGVYFIVALLGYLDQLLGLLPDNYCAMAAVALSPIVALVELIYLWFVVLKGRAARRTKPADETESNESNSSEQGEHHGDTDR
ncbi:MAG: hypothetical protein LBS17_01845 [Actinomycetes bacterium]|jgi:drug/metabolite transporter superfamily protein YnfA|nr:hypothetical protein [Actinomycetes bacterium]